MTMRSSALEIGSSGVLFGVHDHTTVKGHELESLRNVAELVREKADLSLGVDESTLWISGYLPDKISSGARNSGEHGVFIRLVQGAGTLRVPEKVQGFDIDTGEWLYIPANLEYWLSGMMIAGLNLQFAVVNAVPYNG